MKQIYPPEPKNWKKSAWRAVKWTFFIIIAVLAFLFLLGWAEPKITQYFKERHAKKVWTKMIVEEETLIQGAQADTVGGKTPEETLDMFLEALKANNPEKAASYYMFGEQKKHVEEYKEELQKNGNLKQSYDYFWNLRYKGERVCDKDSCGYEYTYITTKTSTSTTRISNQIVVVVTPVGTESTTFVDIYINPFTKLWKIVQP